MTRRATLLCIGILAACSGSPAPPAAPQAGLTAPATGPTATIQGSPSLTHTPSAEIRSEEVSFLAGGRSIHGTVTVPAAPGTYPGLLLLAGSGPTDRDWNTKLLPGKNGSGRLLAERLTRHGVVVLRFDKMGTGRTAPPKTVTWGGFLQEATAALAMLRHRSDVDRARIVVAGHSEGGLHALRLGQQEGHALRGVMLLSSVGRNYGDLMLSQIEASFRKEGGLSGEPLANFMKPIRKAFADFAAGKTVDPRTVGPFPAIQRLVASLVNPASVGLVRPLLAFAPSKAIATLKVPVLVLGGAKDIQVDPTIDGVLLRDAAKNAGVTVTYVAAPDADHVLKHEAKSLKVLVADRGATGRGYNKAGRVLDPASVKAMVTWLVAQTAVVSTSPPAP